MTLHSSAMDGARRGTLTAAGLLLGMGFGGFVDGIAIHQILQWHHMDTGLNDVAFPRSTVASLERSATLDGVFHAGTWVIAIAGLLLLWAALRRGRRVTWRTLVGLMLVGWGLFNLVEGVVNHQVLGIHHLRDDLGGPLSWDLGFLAWGALLIAAGWMLRRSDPQLSAVRVHPRVTASGISGAWSSSEHVSRVHVSQQDARR